MNRMNNVGTIRTENNQAYYDKKRVEKRRRREKVLRRKLILVLVTVIMTVILSVSYSAIMSNANTDLEGIEYKYYASIMVEYGETLWSIAEKYTGMQYVSLEAYIKEVKKINSLADEDILAGQYLIVPYYSSEFVG